MPENKFLRYLLYIGVAASTLVFIALIIVGIHDVQLFVKFLKLFVVSFFNTLFGIPLIFDNNK